MNSASANGIIFKGRDWVLVLLAILILWLAAGLRFYHLEAQSFWNDEGNSARLSERSLPLIIEGTASDIHPPLYYVLLRGWRELLGESEFGLRSFSAYAGILVVASTLALGRLLLNRHRKRLRGHCPAALIAAFLAAINPALIYYSQETRMYSLLALLSAISTLLLWRWLNSRRGTKWAIAYVVTAAAGLYTHYFFPAILLFQNLIVLYWLYRSFSALAFAPYELHNKRPLRQTVVKWLIMLGVVFLLYLPWLPIFIRQAAGRPAIREPFLTFLWQTTAWYSFGETAGPTSLLLPTACVLLLLAWAWFGRWANVIVPSLGAGVVMLFMYAAGTTQPAFFKFMLAGVPFFILWLAGVWGPESRWEKKQWPLGISLALSIPLLWGTADSLSNLYFNPTYSRADYRSMAERIAREDYANAGIILNAPNQWEVFTYYHRKGAPVYPLPKGQPDPAIVEPQLAEIAARHDRLYAIYWGDEQRDPQRVIESWLEANTFKASEEWIGDVRFVVYAVPSTAAAEERTVANVLFGDMIALHAYTLRPQRAVPGEIIQITLYWQTDQPLSNRYKIFLHLLDQGGNLVAQQDSEPAGGLVPTTSWPVGETIVDNHGLLLPEGLPQGTYDLVIGLYEIDDPAERLQIEPDGGLQDIWSLGSIEVE